MSFLDHINPALQTRTGRILGDGISAKFLVAVGASLIVAASAHVTLPLAFTPVPLTLQTLAVLLIGIFLGPTVAFGSLTLYLLEGASGLPVFSPAGPGGPLQMLGPTGGFLFSYPAVAALAGWLYLRTSGSLGRAVSAVFSSLIALTLLFAGGAGWLAIVLHLSVRHTFTAAVLPFLPGEALKVGAIAILAAAFGESRQSHKSSASR